MSYLYACAIQAKIAKIGKKIVRGRKKKATEIIFISRHLLQLTPTDIYADDNIFVDI